MIREPFHTNYCYHILNRGVEKRYVYMDDADRRRFLIYLSIFNTEAPIINLSERLARNEIEAPPRLERLVHIVAYCLMNNHFHLLLVQAKDNGIKQFMHKLGTGYTMFFNKRYDRVGPLFQGVFKAILTDSDSYLNYLPHYIHANSLDYSHPEWREGIIQDNGGAMQSIIQYPWSSFSHYLDKVNDPIIDEESIVDLFSDKKLVANDMKGWINDMASRDNLFNSGVTLE